MFMVTSLNETMYVVLKFSIPIKFTQINVRIRSEVVSIDGRKTQRIKWF
ncbi:hypothetical protein [Clostridium beijerinckii]|nr:hypothetical protein [Clostridium beijerinckii]